MSTASPAISPALRTIIDLETVLSELLEEHRKMLLQLDLHQAAMQTLDIAGIESCLAAQTLTRTRIGRLDDKRKALVLQIARVNQIKGEPKIPAIAELYPQRKNQLLDLRNSLHLAMTRVAERNYIANRVASAVLGHLNTAMRIVAGAVGGGGVYNNRGIPRISRRIGVMEAVG